MTPPPTIIKIIPAMERCTQTTLPKTDKLKEILPSSKGDHESYTMPSTSKDACNNPTILIRKKALNAPKLTMALNTLWKLKMKNMPSGKTPVKNPVIRPAIVSPNKGPMAGGKKDVPPQEEKTVVVDLKKMDYETSDDSGEIFAQRLVAAVWDETLKRPAFLPVARMDLYNMLLSSNYQLHRDAAELLETTGSGYAATAAPQYVTDFAGMEYPLQQHLQNGNTAYVYTADAPYPNYYSYSANVHSPTSYMLPAGGQSPGSGDDDHNSVQHVSRACPATVQWLIENYEPLEGNSLPRCTLYDHYKRHCSEYKLDPVNAASFGKLIRNVFQNLKTRRLGTRGNSKYHYYGIRIKPDSPLNNYSNMNNSPRSALKRPAATMRSQSRNSSSSPVASYSSTSTIASTPAAPPVKMNCASDQDKASLGEGDLPNVNFESFDGIDHDVRRLGLDLSHVCKFIENYKFNCNEVLHFIKALQFDAVEELWTSFWQPDDIEDEDKTVPNDRLNQQQLFSLCTLPQIQNFIINMDIAFYQVIVDILVPNVLMSPMTPSLIQLCRSFAKNAETYMRNALKGAPEGIQKKKIQCVKYMSQGLRRYTSLNHLAHAAQAVLQKQEQVHAMHNDYMKIDITQVQEQAGWVCGCDPIVIFQIHNAFKELLLKSASMSEWSEWMESIVDQNVQILANFHNKPLDEVMSKGKQFLQNWSFYTSILIRDLTLRSATSFGSFHLIRILTDEYMMYLVEGRLAKVLGRPMISVVVQPSDYPLFEEDMKSTPVLPSISLDSSSSMYAPSSSDPMLYGLQYQYHHNHHPHHVINNNENVDIENIDHPEGELTQMQARRDLL